MDTHIAGNTLGTMVKHIWLVMILIIAVGLTSCASAPTSSAAPATASAVIELELGDMYIKPASIDVPAGQPVTLHIKNVGAMAHNVKVNGVDGSKDLATGEDQTIIVGPFTTATHAWCTLPGHKDSGMEMMINIIGAATADSHTAAAPAADSAADGNAKIDAKAVPAEAWQARDPILPAKASGTVHEIALDATETLIEVAPGVTQMMWTFGNTVPGPIFHGNIGDTFKFTLTNKGIMGHSIDFHAGKVAWNKSMRTIKTGESLVYEFKADYAGAYMYHCGTAPALHHIGNGMYGAIIIDPPTLAPVEKEFVIIQSELYLGPQANEGDLRKMLAEQWDAVVFNGYYNQYKFRPIHVDSNKRYRVWVVDDGPSENSAFHIVGTVFDTVYKEGSYLLQPDARQGGSQVLDLQPAQGGFVEFSFAEDGLYPMVTHKFANASKGALGFFAAGAVDTSMVGGH